MTKQALVTYLISVVCGTAARPLSPNICALTGEAAFPSLKDPLPGGFDLSELLDAGVRVGRLLHDGTTKLIEVAELVQAIRQPQQGTELCPALADAIEELGDIGF
jgi:hypothetical protein